MNAPTTLSPALQSTVSTPDPIPTPIPVIAASAGVDLALQLEEQRRQQKQQQLQLELQIKQLQLQLQQQKSQPQQSPLPPATPPTPGQALFSVVGALSSSPYESGMLGSSAPLMQQEMFPDIHIGLTPVEEISSPSGDFDADVLMDFNPSASMELFLRSTAAVAQADAQHPEELVLHVEPHTQPLSPSTVNFHLSEHSSSSDNSPAFFLNDRNQLMSNGYAVRPSGRSPPSSATASLHNSGTAMSIDVEEVPTSQIPLRTSAFFASSNAPSPRTPYGGQPQLLTGMSGTQPQTLPANHPALSLMPIPTPAPNKADVSCPGTNEGLLPDVDIDKLAESVDKLVICPTSGKEITPQALMKIQEHEEAGANSSFEVCHNKMSEMMWRLADKTGQNEFSPTLGAMFQKMLSVMMPTVALFDISRHQLDFSGIALRLKIALQMTADLQQPAVICHARTILYVNDKMHQLTGGVIAARSRQTSARFYDFDLLHPEDAVRYFSLTLDKIADKQNDERLLFRVVSAASPAGYVTCLVSHSMLFEKFTAMPMFSMLTFTRVDDLNSSPPAPKSIGY